MRVLLFGEAAPVVLVHAGGLDVIQPDAMARRAASSGEGAGLVGEAVLTLYPVVLCGGSGTRLWPASRPHSPKQFLPLVGERSLFQTTVERVKEAPGAGQVLVVAGAGHVAAVRRQLAGIGANAVVIAEPEGRDSAPAICAAALWIAARDPEGVALVTASDHHIPDTAAFAAAAGLAAKAARRGAIVTFGVRPARPATGYGYIEAGAAFEGAPGVFHVRRFVEKPDEATARAYVEAGLFWNSGNFVFPAQNVVDELRELAPELVRAVEAAIEGATVEGPVLRLGEAFRTAPRISIDFALMEKTARAAVTPVDYAWSDLGAWGEILNASTRDQAGNAAPADAILVETRGSYVRSATGQTVALVGLEGVGVIVEPDAVLVCDLGSGQGVKAVAEAAAARAGAAQAADPGEALRARAGRLEAWMFTCALPVWWTLGADHERGGFHESLDQDARPTGAPRRLRVQARQVVAYATALRLGWPGPALDPIRHGLAWLDNSYLRPDGLYRTLVDARGAPLDDAAVLYDHAFVLLALAAAAEVLPERRGELEARAGALLGRIRSGFAHDRGGLREAAAGREHQSNPLMHLFEAAQAWSGALPAFADLADELARHCLDRLIDPGTGVLRELYDADWRPAPGEDGRIIWPGHQFEWAWLLEQWGRARGSERALQAARRLFEIGEAGVDPARGVALDDLHDDLSPGSSMARLWPQTERLKAASILAEAEPEGRARARYLEAAVEAADALERYFETPVRGLWRDRMDAAGRFLDGPAPASSFYHVMGALAELQGLRLIGP